ncbi:DUF6318 family protein [Nocardioides hungaricus]
MTGPRAVVAAVVAAVVLVLGLAACSGDPEPRVAPPSPTVPSTTRASVQTPPEMPAAAKGTDAAAAEAFVRFYWETVNYAQETGDLSSLREISAKTCIACQAGLDYLEDVFAKDGAISGGRGRVGNPETAFATDGGVTYAVVDFDLRMTRQRVDLPGSGDDEVYAGGTSEVRARLAPTASGWVMDYWDKL